MQRLEVSGAVRLVYRSLGVKGLRHIRAAIVAMEKQSITYSGCVFVTLVIQHTMDKCHIVICDLSGSMSFHMISLMA